MLHGYVDGLVPHQKACSLGKFIVTKHIFLKTLPVLDPHNQGDQDEHGG